MPAPAKTYIGCILALGAFSLGFAAYEWQCSDAIRYLTYAALAILAAAFKAQLPGMRGTISISFVLVLIGIAELGFSETLVTAAAVAIVQSVWRCKRRPKLVQVAFNASVLASSSGVAYLVAFAIRTRLGHNGFLIEMTVAAWVYFLLNTFMVSEVLALLQDQKVMAIWKNCHLWSFPYYLVGAAIAVLSSAASRSAGWQASLLVLPVMAMVYVCYRAWIDRLKPEEMTANG